MNAKFLTSSIFWGAIVILLYSCQKEIQHATPKSETTISLSQVQQDQIALTKEVTDLLKNVYQDPKALYEVCAAIYSGYYKDERVLLKDLLFPETSPIYKSEEFKNRKAEPGVFKNVFWEFYQKGDYPYLKEALKPKSKRGNENLLSIESNTAAFPTDTSMEIFSNSNGVSIYFPYSENFGSSFTPSYFDNINKSVYGPLATLVNADRESDSGLGSEPYIVERREYSGPVFYYIFYRTVTVDDTYAEQKPTHIVGVSAEPAKIQSVMDIQGKLVFIGDVKCTKQYDRLISFTGNGGGSELRFIRGDGYLKQNDNGQITSPENTISVNLTRKNIRKEQWKKVYSIWDSNWEQDNKEQVFGIYEEDNEGSKTFNGSIQTTLKFGDNSTQIGPIGFSMTVKSNDPIIRQLNWNRESFFQFNRGGLNNGCGVKDGWTIYDCNTSVMYTMPEQ
jgi:hypothetical protein